MSGSSPGSTSSRSAAGPEEPAAAGPLTATTGRRPRRRGLTSRTIAPYLFVLPNMVIFGLFTIWPALNGFNISLYDSSNGRKFTFVGLGNYREIITDPEFWGVARNTVVFVVGFVVLVTICSTALALLLRSPNTMSCS